MSLFDLIANSAKELTGQYSSKRVNAYYGAVLMGLIVCSILFCLIYYVITGKEILASTLNLIFFVGGAVLVSIIGYILTLFGYNTSQNKAAITAGIVKIEDKITPAS
jgi:membrane protein YdbS with pleckstrin-like domain